MNIWEACRIGDFGKVKELLSDQTLIDFMSVNGYTPLHVASFGGHINIVKLLLNFNVDIDIKDIDNETPLHDACSNGRSEVVKLLLDKGADINKKDAYGNTPYHFALKNGRLNTLKLLIKEGSLVIFDSSRKRIYLTSLESKRKTRISLPFLILLDLFIY